MLDHPSPDPSLRVTHTPTQGLCALSLPLTLLKRPRRHSDLQESPVYTTGAGAAPQARRSVTTESRTDYTNNRKNLFAGQT